MEHHETWEVFHQSKVLTGSRFCPEDLVGQGLAGSSCKKLFCRTSVATVPQLVYQFVVSHVTPRSTQFSQARWDPQLWSSDPWSASTTWPTRLVHRRFWAGLAGCIYIYKYKKRMLQISKLVTVGYLMIYSCIFIFDDDYSYSFEQWAGADCTCLSLCKGATLLRRWCYCCKLLLFIWSWCCVLISFMVPILCNLIAPLGDIWHDARLDVFFLARHGIHGFGQRDWGCDGSQAGWRLETSEPRSPFSIGGGQKLGDQPFPCGSIRSQFFYI